MGGLLGERVSSVRPILEECYPEARYRQTHNLEATRSSGGGRLQPLPMATAIPEPWFNSVVGVLPANLVRALVCSSSCYSGERLLLAVRERTATGLFHGDTAPRALAGLIAAGTVARGL
jgi:hypothetical protein